jgi:hypothetical protein
LPHFFTIVLILFLSIYGVYTWHNKQKNRGSSFAFFLGY